MDVSIIIVNYKTKEVTQNCINSIFEHTKGIEFEVILVDNNSDDGSAECFYLDNRIKFIVNHTNIGFGGANNIGYQHSTGDYILCLNSDTILFENSIKILYDLYKKYESRTRIGVLGGRMVDINHRHNGSAHLLPKLTDFTNLVLYKLIGKKHILLPEFLDDADCVKVECVTGADLFLSRHVIEMAGGLFDPEIFMYNEESELQLRIMKMKYVNYVTNTTSIIHLQGATLTTISNQKNKDKFFNQFKMNMKSRNYLLRKHYSITWRYLYYFLRFIFYSPIILLGKDDYKRKFELIKILYKNE